MISGTFGVVNGITCPNGLYSHKSGSNSLCVESCAAYGLAIDGLACSATCSNNDYVMQPTNGELICQAACNVTTPILASPANRTCVSCLGKDGQVRFRYGREESLKMYCIEDATGLRQDASV